MAITRLLRQVPSGAHARGCCAGTLRGRELPEARRAAHAIAVGPDIFTALGYALNLLYLAAGIGEHDIVAGATIRVHARTSLPPVSPLGHSSRTAGDTWACLS